MPCLPEEDRRSQRRCAGSLVISNECNSRTRSFSARRNGRDRGDVVARSKTVEERQSVHDDVLLASGAGLPRSEVATGVPVLQDDNCAFTSRRPQADPSSFQFDAPVASSAGSGLPEAMLAAGMRPPASSGVPQRRSGRMVIAGPGALDGSQNVPKTGLRLGARFHLRALRDGVFPGDRRLAGHVTWPRRPDAEQCTVHTAQPRTRRPRKERSQPCGPAPPI